MDTIDREELVRAAGSGRYWNRKVAEAVVAAFEASGESMTDFARRRGLRQDRLQRWHRALSRATSAADPTRFHPVVVADPTAVAGSESRLELILANGRRVGVREGFDAATLLELVRVLEEAGC